MAGSRLEKTLMHLDEFGLQLLMFLGNLTTGAIRFIVLETLNRA